MVSKWPFFLGNDSNHNWLALLSSHLLNNAYQIIDQMREMIRENLSKRKKKFKNKAKLFVVIKPVNVAADEK